MSNDQLVRATVAYAALNLFPPLIRSCLLDEPGFRREYGIEAEKLLNLGDSGVSISARILLGAAREVLSGTEEVEVTDINDMKWMLRKVDDPAQSEKWVLLSDETRLIIPDLTVLSCDDEARLRSLNELGRDVNLPETNKEKWREVLSIRPFDENEVHSFHDDLNATPVHVEQTIKSVVNEREFTVSSLVPSSRLYYERLVGKYDGSASISNYASSTGKQFLEQLSSWRPYDGFLFSLLLSSHSTPTGEICINNMEEEDLVRAYTGIVKQGDLLSKLGAIEVGLRSLPRKRKIEPILIQLLKQIRDEKADTPGNGFQLLSALFNLVDGGLAKSRLLCKEPPFYRRLASLAHAALIHREILNSKIDVEKFCVWSSEVHSEYFCMQSLADMRLEPEWNVDLSAAPQLRATFLGRIMMSAHKYEISVNSPEIDDLISGEDSASIRSVINRSVAFFPGPLEGTTGSLKELPSELIKFIGEQLLSNVPEPSSFAALVNSAKMYRIDPEMAKSAAMILKAGNHRLENVEDKFHLLAVLYGLATVAAVSRSPLLADELRVVCRRYRSDVQLGVSIDEEIRICLIAAAGREGLMDWRDFAGEWLTELAFTDLDREEAITFDSRLQRLLHAVPELWVSCGKADAALKSMVGNS